MEIRPYEENRKKEWDSFCLESKDSWFWHTSGWLEYTLNYDPDFPGKNLSFFVIENGEVKAICPLVLEDGKEGKQFSFGGNYTPLPALKNNLDLQEKNKIRKFVFEYTDKLAKEHKVKIIKFKSTALDQNFLEDGYKSEFNYPIQFGFLDVSIGTQILDLSLSIEDLKRNLRHGHKSDVVKAEKNLEFLVIDKDNLDKEVFERYCKAKMGHGSTRPKITFDLMFDFIKKDEAFLIAALHNKEIVSFSYFFVYKNNAYYGSSVNLNEDRNLAFSHGIQWQAIKYMKEKGVCFYEIGWQVFAPGLNDFSSQKEISISKFKRGFGGQIFPLFMTEKYYDKKYFSKIWKDRLKRYIKSYDK